MEQVLNLINTRIVASKLTGNTTEEFCMKAIKNEVENIIYQRDSYFGALKSALQTNDALLKRIIELSGEVYE